MSDTRILQCWESPLDLTYLRNMLWRFHIAKWVKDSGGKAFSNVIWQSKVPEPIVAFRWQQQYALAWSLSPPQSGNRVTYGGVWQPCNRGEAYDIDKNGIFVPSSSPGQDGWLKIGSVNYQYPGVTGIYIIVGIQDAMGQFSAIYVDPTQLTSGGTAVYQPLEQVTWWLQVGNLNQTVYSQTQGSVGGQDYSSPASMTNKYEWWTTYKRISGEWVNTQTHPLPSYTSVELSISMLEANWPDFIAFMSSYLPQQIQGVNVDITTRNGQRFKIVWSTVSPPLYDIPNTMTATRNGLIRAQKLGKLPDQEVWVIKESWESEPDDTT